MQPRLVNHVFGAWVCAFLFARRSDLLLLKTPNNGWNHLPAILPPGVPSTRPVHIVGGFRENGGVPKSCLSPDDPGPNDLGSTWSEAAHARVTSWSGTG